MPNNSLLITRIGDCSSFFRIWNAKLSHIFDDFNLSHHTYTNLFNMRSRINHSFMNACVYTVWKMTVRIFGTKNKIISSTESNAHFVVVLVCNHNHHQAWIWIHQRYEHGSNETSHLMTFSTRHTVCELNAYYGIMIMIKGVTKISMKQQPKQWLGIGLTVKMRKLNFSPHQTNFWYTFVWIACHVCFVRK